jgi:hypothetical protein
MRSVERLGTLRHRSRRLTTLKTSALSASNSSVFARGLSETHGRATDGARHRRQGRLRDD